MSLLSHQSYANLTTPLWLSATAPAVAQSPFSVVDNKNVPTKQVTIGVSSNGTADYTLANFGTGNNPVRMRFIQPAGPQQALIQFNTGNVADALVLGQTSSTSLNEFRVAVSGSATSNLVLSNTLNAGVISSGTTVMKLSNNGIFDVGGYFRMGSLGYVFSNAGGCNGNTSSLHYFRTGGSPSVTVGGMGIQGTDGALYFGTSNFTTNLSNITAYQFAIDKFGVVGTYGTAFQIHDPVTFSNFINFSNAAGQGYLDLVANTGSLYPQIQFGSNVTSLPRETIVFGSTSTAGVSAYIQNGNLYGLTDPTQIVTNYLDTNTHNWVFATQTRTGASIPAIVIGTNGVVTFPQGISVSSFNNAVLNGVTRYATNVATGLVAQNVTTTVTSYSPYYYTWSVYGASAGVVFDFRTQLFGQYNPGTFVFEFWNSSVVNVAVGIVVTNAGFITNLAPLPPNSIYRIMIDSGQANFTYMMIPSTVTMVTDNYLIT